MAFTKEQIDLILNGREERQLEYKGTIDFSVEANKAIVSRAIAALCNARDGGDIVVGMEKNGEAYAPVGMKQAHLATLKLDELRDYIRAHFLPMPNFKLDLGEYDEKAFVIIRVSPFGLYPCVCIKGFQADTRPTLTKGAIYVRSKRKPESAPLETEEDLAELIDTAADRWLQYRAKRDKASGFISPDEAREKFEAEGGDL